MKFFIEVVADEREDVATLLREVARKIKLGKEQSGAEVNYCLGDYRVLRDDDVEYQLTRKPIPFEVVAEFDPDDDDRDDVHMKEQQDSLHSVKQ